MAHAHLNGSLNLPDAETVFRTVGEILGDSVERIPDGETGARFQWIGALIPRLAKTDGLFLDVASDDYSGNPKLRIVDGFAADELVLPALGYADAARNAWPIFRRLRDEEGVIAPGTRFQVSLATATAGLVLFAPDTMEAVRPAYTRRLHAELDEILELVPHEDLAIQWDVAVEMGMIEGAFPLPFDPFDIVVGQLGELSGWVPAEVPLGYHLCYGDAQEVTGEGEGRHFKQPVDTGTLVRVANAVTAASRRPLQWFSFPVPIDRDDDAYFAPLAGLALHPGCRLFLGLVHHQDGVEGTQRRIETARRHVAEFGVSTECGMGRKPAELTPKLLHIHRDVTV